MIKNLGFAAAFMLAAGTAGAEPYIQGVWSDGHPVYLSEGATFTPTSMKYDRTFTNVAVLYHPLSAGSIIPEKLRPFIPPESWACTVGGGYWAEDGNAGVGVGCGINLLDSVRAWGSEILSMSHNATLYAIGRQIAPGSGPLNLYVSRQENINIGGKFVPRWFLGGAFYF